VAIVPQGYHAIALEDLIGRYREAPLRLAQAVHFTELDSFIAYVAQFLVPETAVFLALGQSQGVLEPEFLAVIDYHGKDAPSWCEHRAWYKARTTPEWARVMGKANVSLTQTQLVEFLEDNARLIVDPPGAELLELAMNLEGKNDIRCNNIVRLATGKQQLIYEEDVTLKGVVSQQAGKVEFPTRMVLGLAPYVGGPGYKIECRLRYRIESRALRFWFQPVDVHLVIELALHAMSEAISEKLKLSVLAGMPLETR
jgi:uncharacterized protein YfdQ (DUF2303 family)